MELALIAAAVACAAGLLRGGSLASLADTRFRWTWLVFAALLVQILFAYWTPSWLSRDVSLLVLLLSTVGVSLFLLANYALPGTLVAGAGLALNVLVIAANQAMPVSEAAAEAAGAPTRGIEAGFKHEPMTDETILPLLSDVIPVPVFGSVLSTGDLLLIAGIAYLVYRRTTATAAETATEASGSPPEARP